MADNTFINSLADALKKLGVQHAVGEQWISADGVIPPGGVPFCGQLVSRALYADLWAWAQAQDRVKPEQEWQSLSSSQGGDCVFYSDGDGSTTFRMPKIVGYLRGSESSSAAGKHVAEGLPNITGEVWQYYDNAGGWHAKDEATAQGAFSFGRSLTSSCTWGDYGDAKSLVFDASSSNPIYGNAAHVVPETSTVLVGVYAVSIYTNVGKLDAPALQTEVSALQTEVSALQTEVSALQTEVSAIPRANAYITETWRSEDGQSWYRKWSDGWVEQGGRNTSVKGEAWFTVTFSTAFTDINYDFLRTTGGQTTGAAGVHAYAGDSGDRTTTSIKIRHGANATQGYNWVAFGR